MLDCLVKEQPHVGPWHAPSECMQALASGRCIGVFWIGTGLCIGLGLGGGGDGTLP